MPITELPDTDPIDWIYHPFVARGMATLVVGIWKGGKTTLMAYLARAMGGHPEALPGDVAQGNVLILSEESPSMWSQRRDEIGIGPNVFLHCRPFIYRPDSDTWHQAILETAELVTKHDFRVAILDTLIDLSPCDDENDSAKMIEVLKPLRLINDAGAALILLHHPAKTAGGEGRASRGSGALPGWADIILEIERFDKQRMEHRKRVFKTLSRLDSCEEVFELTEDGYICIGPKALATKRAKMEVIDGILSYTEDESKPWETIRDQWPEDRKAPSNSAIKALLKKGIHEEGWGWVRRGDGVKNSPHLYWKQR